MRFLLALLTSVSMLHLSLVGGDLPCATHASGGAHASGGVHEMAGMPMHPDAPTDDCATPIQPRCCDVMAGCSVTAALGVLTHASTATTPDVALPRTAAMQPASILTAPEPPPPKA
jgi:hypothetical protein